MILCGDRARRLGLVGLVLVLCLWAVGVLFSPGLAQTRPRDQEEQVPLDRGRRVLGERVDRGGRVLGEPLGERLAQARPKPQDAPAEAAPREVYRGKTALTDQQDLRDEIELLTVQLEAKKAELQEAEAFIEQASRRAADVARGKASGVVSSTEADQAQTDVRVLAARKRAKEAQVREVELRLTQANRRLGKPRQPDDLGGVTFKYPPASSTAASGESRFDSLEKKLDALTREVAALRQELRLQRPRDFFPDKAPVYEAPVKAPVYEKPPPRTKPPAPEKAPLNESLRPPADEPAPEKPTLVK